MATYDKNSEIVQNHCHPPQTAVVPRGTYRRAAMTFAGVGGIANNDTVTVGYTANQIIYKFVLALGAPAPNNVEILNTGTIIQKVRKLNDAIGGVVDLVNIAYGAGTQPNPDVQSGVTIIRWAIGTTQIAATANGSLYMRFKVGDRTATAFPSTFTTIIVGAVITNFTRTYSQRYVMNGNSAVGTPPNDCIAGDYQMFQPLGWVKDGSGNLVRYDSPLIVVEASSMAVATVIEADIYYSTDEITFVKMVDGLNISFNVTTGAGSMQFFANQQRIPAGGGLYIRVRSNDTSNVATVDLKVEYHRYPVGV